MIKQREELSLEETAVDLLIHFYVYLKESLGTLYANQVKRQLDSGVSV